MNGSSSRQGAIEPPLGEGPPPWPRGGGVTLPARTAAGGSRTDASFRVLEPESSSPALSRFVAREADALLTGPLDLDTALRRIARLAVPVLADWCLIDLIGEDGQIRRMAGAHVDPAGERLVAELCARFPSVCIDTPDTLSRVLRTGDPVVNQLMGDAELVARARNAQHLALLRALGYRAEMVVPLVACNRSLGTITFVSTRAPRYGPTDLALAQELATRAAIAIDNISFGRN